MNDFVTPVSESIKKRGNNNKKDGNKIFFCMLGAAILASGVLCLLLLWQKRSVRNTTELKAETQKVVSETILAESPSDSMSELYEITSEDASESMIAEYADEEALKQQYLTSVEYLKEKVGSLLQSISNTKETLQAVVDEQENDTELKEQISEITGEITSLMLLLQNEQLRINELKESITAMNSETIWTVQENIDEIEEQVSTLDGNILDIYIKINTLKAADEKIQQKLDDIEKNLNSSVAQNMNDVTNQFNSVDDKIQQMEGDTQTNIQDIQTKINSINTYIQELASQLLQYQYDANTNTLHLSPIQ